MPHFFFDFRQDEARSPDTLGLKCANAEDAYLEAFQAAREMWAELLVRRDDPRQCAFEVRDSEHELLFILPFQEVLDCCGNRRPARLHGNLENAAHIAERAKRACEQFSTELHAMRNTLELSRTLLLAKI